MIPGSSSVDHSESGTARKLPFLGSAPNSLPEFSGGLFLATCLIELPKKLHLDEDLIEHTPHNSQF